MFDRSVYVDHAVAKMFTVSVIVNNYNKFSVNYILLTLGHRVTGTSLFFPVVPDE